ncbi:PAAR domain-containing protein [Halomonas sp. ISL-56]|uniref:PAAR domain-containing protein n=1 Tax=Halomonas sp. ISL-56 TaxID=2819149 RepID=UPI002035B144|nr:PAAR domain-containing protein [Halomonas sp. ISL-56]
MKPVARKGDLHRCPIPGHGTTEIVSGSPSQVEGQPVARVSDKTGCEIMDRYKFIQDNTFNFSDS